MIKFDEFIELLKSNRSVRRFDESRRIDGSLLKSLVELTRYCASGRNLQPLRYRIADDKATCEKLFPALKWAGYYSDWDGPAEGERPVAYLVQCIDTELCASCLCDDGLELEAITLGASSMGIHGTIIKSFNMEMVKNALGLPERYKPHYVLALGYPAEKVRIVSTDGTTGADIRYYRDENDMQVVPKRPLEERII